MCTTTGKPKVGQGIFGVKGRELPKIIDAQSKFMKSLSLKLKQMDNYGIYKNNAELAELMSKMLEVDPIKRISPKEIMEHPFCMQRTPAATNWIPQNNFNWFE